jgi:replicative DNA helicase
MFLYRPEYYKITVDEDGMPTQGMGEVIIAKHRNGSTGSVKLKFIGKFTKFADFDELPSSDNPFSGMIKLGSRMNTPPPDASNEPPPHFGGDEETPF